MTRVRGRLPVLPRGAYLLLTVALVLRLALVAATFDTPLTLDAADFSGHGLSIAQGHGYPPSNRAPAGGASAFRPPGYPVFLAAVYAAVGEEASPIARMVQALVGAIAAGLVGLIAGRLWGRRVGVVALGIAAFAPSLVVLGTAPVSEGLFVALVLGAVATALQARRSPRPLRWALATGVLVGLGELTRTNAAVLLIPLGLAVWDVRPRWRARALLRPAVVVVAAALTVVPWTIRNALVFHAFVPVSTQVGYTLAGTYNRESRMDTRWPAVWKEAEHGASPEYAAIVDRAKRERWDERRLGDRLQEAALRDIGHAPAYVLEAGWWNTVRMLHLGELDFAVANLRDTDVPAIPAWLEIGGFYVLGVLALGGTATRRARQAPVWLWLVPLAVGTTVFVTGFIRFRAGIDPFLVMLAALAVVSVAERRAQRTARRTGSTPCVGR